jgi:hypothetical protein
VLGGVIGFLSGGDSSAAPVFSPYQPDEHTLHLWHLDESGPPFQDSAGIPCHLLGLLNGASPGQEAMDGFGRSVSFNHRRLHDQEGKPIYGPILLARPRLDDR